MSDQMEAPPPSEPQASNDAVANTEPSSATEPQLKMGGVEETAAESGDATAPGESSGEGAGTAGDAGGDEQPSDGAAASGENAAAAGDGKRKRRRRRKKKGGEEGGSDDRPKKESSHAPFAHLFAGGAAKRHAFAAGEVVAGRVIRLEDGAVVVDLFGKALAYADEHEPREVPPAPEPVPEETTEASKATSESSEAGQSEGPSEGQGSEGQGDADTAQVAAPEVAAEDALANEADSAAYAAADAAPPPVEAPAAVDQAETATQEDVEGDEASEDSDEGEDGSKGPLAAAPVVPEEFPRLEPLTMGGIFKGRVGSVSESGHIVLVNRNVVRADVRAAIAGYREERRRVEGLVYGYNRGGFDVLVQGVRAFCPASAISLHEIKDPSEFLGRKYEFLLPASKGGKDIVVSRRSILERQARKRAKEVLRSLEAGQVLDGTVTSVRDFGVFVDLGGVEGLVHQSELAHGFGVKPADVANPGDAVKVKVLRVGGDGGRKGDRKDRLTRVSLSMKALQPDPWDSHAEAVAEGTVREGKITRTTDFGAFVELAPSVEGLLHISELGRDLQHANQAVNEGDAITVVVERVDRKARRISLSKLTDAEMEEFKAGTLTGQENAKNVRPGSRIEVVVDRADHRGVQVRIAGVIGRRSRGFIPASETGTDRGSDLRKQFPTGQKIEVKVIGNDRDGGLKCSIKAMAIDDERKAVKDYRREASKQGFGTFGDLLKAKLGQTNTD